MKPTDPRDILTAVAAGSLSPAEAAVLLDKVHPAEDGGAQPSPDPAPPVPPAPAVPAEPAVPAVPADPAAAAEPAVPAVPAELADGSLTQPIATSGAQQRSVEGRARRVRVELNGGGPVEIECRPEVDTPRVEGPTDVTITETDTDTLVEGEVGSDSLVTLPSLLDLTLEVNAGDCRIHGLDGTIDAELNCGNVALSARLVDGGSRVRANAGNVEITLHPDSDVTLVIQTPAHIEVDESFTHTARGVWTRGSGNAELTLAGHTGNVSVRVA